MRIFCLFSTQVLLLCVMNDIVDGWSINSSWRTPMAAAPRQAFVPINRRRSSRYWPLFQAKGVQKSSASDADPTNTTIGIGGRDGFVYDVNSLKRNIVQETVRKFKNEIWSLLGDPLRDDNILEDKLAALVQTSPVSTTTDSNLLDGDWKYVFGSRQPASTLLDPRRFEIDTRQNSKSSVQQGSSATGCIQDGLFRSSCREIHLENVLDDEDSYVLDRTSYLGGLFTRTRRYTIKRLTRTTLDMALEYSHWSCFGNKHTSKRRAAIKAPSQAVRILYLDSDLCIAVTSSDDPAKSAFQVYTKSDAWASHAKRVKRRFASTLSRFQSYVYSFLRAVKRMLLPSNTPQPEDSALAIGELPRASDAQGVRVVTLGDSDNDEYAWEGEEDPFVHLSADDRQEYLKQLLVRDVTKAGRRFQRRNKRTLNVKKWSSRKTFKRPD